MKLIDQLMWNWLLKLPVMRRYVLVNQMNEFNSYLMHTLILLADENTSFANKWLALTHLTILKDYYSDELHSQLIRLYYSQFNTWYNFKQWLNRIHTQYTVDLSMVENLLAENRFSKADIKKIFSNVLSDGSMSLIETFDVYTQVFNFFESSYQSYEKLFTRTDILRKLLS